MAGFRLAADFAGLLLDADLFAGPRFADFLRAEVFFALRPAFFAPPLRAADFAPPLRRELFLAAIVTGSCRCA